MTKNEFSRLISFHKAAKGFRKALPRNGSKASAKAMKHNAKYQRRDGKKKLILSIESFPWLK